MFAFLAKSLTFGMIVLMSPVITAVGIYHPEAVPVVAMTASFVVSAIAFAIGSTNAGVGTVAAIVAVASISLALYAERLFGVAGVIVGSVTAVLGGSVLGMLAIFSAGTTVFLGAAFGTFLVIACLVVFASDIGRQ